MAASIEQVFIVQKCCLKMILNMYLYQLYWLTLFLKYSIFEIGRGYYPYAFSEECKHVKKLLKPYISNKAEISSNAADESDDSDEENGVKGCVKLIFNW